MGKLPTAKDFYLKKVFPTSFENKPDEVKLWFETDGHAKEVVDVMIEFAKLHVEAALKEASECPSCLSPVEQTIEFILECYPLSNIK